ncbi:MAG: hypothetical protein GTN46_00520 [Gammaproteobacteria bacterium]|nr:hypothetical protein [Gammaproteobacteria bacterium]
MQQWAGGSPLDCLGKNSYGLGVVKINLVLGFVKRTGKSNFLVCLLLSGEMLGSAANAEQDYVAIPPGFVSLAIKSKFSTYCLFFFARVLK